MVYAMCTSVMQTRMLSSGPDSTVTFGVTDESIFKQLKLSHDQLPARQRDASL